MKVNLIIRKARCNKDGLVPIELSICINGVRRLVSSERSILPSKFSSKTQKVKNDDELNAFPDSLKKKLYSIETQLINKGVRVSVDTVIDVYRNGDKNSSISLIQLCYDVYQTISKKVEQKMLTQSTLCISPG